MELADLDLVVLAQLLGRVLDQQALARLAAGGHPEARPRHGYVFQRLLDGPEPVGRIAAQLDVTQQAVSKTVAEMERLGYVERVADPADARVRLVALTPAGRAVVEASRTVRADIAAELAAALGARRAAQLRAGLADALTALGGTAQVTGRRVRPPEGL